MRKVILGLAITLDGYIEGPNGEYDWCFTDQDYGMADFLRRVDSMFIGRKSYELLHGAGDLGNMFSMLKEYVFSNTLHSVQNNAAIIRGDVVSQVHEIKQNPGKDIWLFGGASLTTAMMNAGMVDVLWLSVHPILLGGGMRLFDRLNERTELTLTDKRVYDTGLASLTYDIQSNK